MSHMKRMKRVYKRKFRYQLNQITFRYSKTKKVPGPYLFNSVFLYQMCIHYVQMVL